MRRTDGFYARSGRLFALVSLGDLCSSTPAGLRYKVNDMAAASRPLLTAIALLVVAPIGAAVVISALLLFGVTPHLVFLPGFAVRTKLAALGFHAPNAVGVLATLAVWWAIIVIVWVAVRRFWRGPA